MRVDCALCGAQCRHNKQSLATAFEGRGMPPDEDVQRLVPKEWLNRQPDLARSALPVQRSAGFLHNEAVSTGRSCYRVVNDMWRCLSMEQVSSHHHHHLG